MKVISYTETDRLRWNAFLEEAKNPHFFFTRDFLDYHGNRFRDASCLVENEQGKLVALFVANQEDVVLYAHQGLSFGGFVWQEKLRTTDIFQITAAVLTYWQARGIRKCAYRLMPSYQEKISSHDIFLKILFYLGATRQRLDLSAVCVLQQSLKYSKRKQRNIRKGKHLLLRELTDWKHFEPLLRQQLWSRHGVRPVHSVAEMNALVEKFPAEISTYGTFHPENPDTLLAGATFFNNRKAKTIHAQYMTVSEEGRKQGALDFLIHEQLTEKTNEGYRYFSFGISSEAEGQEINAGLLRWKEEWGAALFAHETYLIDVQRWRQELIERWI